MNKKFTFLLVVATLLMALSIQSQNVRQALRKSALTSAKFLGKAVKPNHNLSPGEKATLNLSPGEKATLNLSPGKVSLYSSAAPKSKKTPLPWRRVGSEASVAEPQNVPYDADFSKTDEALNDFIIINNNDDTSDGEPCTWTWSAGNGAYYVYNQDGATAADDYLVLPVNLQGGKAYEVRVNAATWNYPEEFEVVAGTECTAEGLTTTVIPKTTPENDAADYTGIFTPEADGLYYVAVHAISPADLYILSVYRFSIDIAPDPAAPAAVADFTVGQVVGQLKTIVEFTAPTETIGGEALTGNVTVEVSRDGEVVATLTDLEPGSEQSIANEVPAEGTYRYEAVASNAAGKGRKIDAVSVKVTMPKTLPYTVDFGDADTFYDMQVIDNNGDGSTWTSTYHEEEEMTAAYQYNWDNPADDYLVSQPLRLQGGKSYVVTVRAAANSESSPERMEVVAGTRPTATGLNISVIGTTDLTSGVFSEYEGTFTAEKDGIYYVAVHALSDPNSYYLYVTNLTVEQGPEPTAPAAPTLTAEPAAEGALKATVQVEAPQQCIDGSALTAITKLELYRDNSLIAQQENVKPGATVSFDDEDIEASGLYNYHALAYNENGKGEKSEKLAVYVGVDQPAEPTNVQAVDHGATVDFSWDAVTTGLHDGYVKPEDITYDVWTLTVSPYFVFFNDKVASVTGATAVTADYNTDEGEEQGYTYFAVRAINESVADEDKAEWGYTSLFTGKPYDVPVAEGFANEELHYFWESNGLIMIAGYASDNDGSAMALLTETAGNVLFMSGKLNLNGTTDPRMVFSALSPNISQMHILGDMDGKGDWQLLQTVTLTDEDYQNYQVSLASLKDHERYARIVFLAEYKTAATADDEGNLTDYGDYIFIDDIRIGDFKDNDLATLISTPESVTAGHETTLLVGAQNVGMMPATGYTLTVKAGEKELYSETVTETLSPFTTSVTEVKMPTTIFDEAGDMSVTATITYEADEDNDNNTATGVVVILDPDLQAPENLMAEETAEGVELAWTAPVPTAKEYTEDFESGTGDFTQIDANADGQGWVYMNGEVKSNSGTGVMQSYSWVPEGVGAVTPDNWLVTPLAILDGTFSFWASAQDGEWTDEHFAVYVSTKGSESADDFEMVSEEFVTSGFPQEYTVDLSSYEGKTGYIAIRHFNCYDNFAMVVDDISFTMAPAVLQSYNVYVDQQLVATVTGETTTYTALADQLTDGDCTFDVTAVYEGGKESRPATTTITVTTGIQQLATGGKPVDVYSLDGKLLRRQTSTLEGLKGIYVIDGKTVMVK